LNLSFPNEASGKGQLAGYCPERVQETQGEELNLAFSIAFFGMALYPEYKIPNGGTA